MKERTYGAKIEFVKQGNLHDWHEVDKGSGKLELQNIQCILNVLPEVSHTVHLLNQEEHSKMSSSEWRCSSNDSFMEMKIFKK